ncbi:MAG: lysoplasmalogenase, partial [Flavobacteriales bacterium]
NKTGIFFIVGLGSFLIAHLGYSIGFYRNIKSSLASFNYKKAALFSVPFILITGPFFMYIRPGIPAELFVPVLAYTTVITVMGMFSVWRYGHVNTTSFRWMFAGAVLFILSDCVLATNLFAIKPEPFSETFKFLAAANMTLYLSGQLLITKGAIDYKPEPS